jgi:DNA topoisomerase-1
MEKLQHNGVLVLPRYEGKGLVVFLRGNKVSLTSPQEEMAVAWAKKIGTPYVQDPKFAENFHKSFSNKLGVDVQNGDVDFSPVLRVVEEERQHKANLSSAEKKRQAAERKAQREANKEIYGYAIVDGVRIEVGNYTVEPNSIFMGRGQHPKRGSWKEGPREEDIELNLSPDAEEKKGKLTSLGFRVVWDPNSIWIARWKDKLSGKMKYVWPSDSSPIKQRKDIEKFEKARELEQNLATIQQHILSSLDAEDLKRRKTATVCYLIDALKIRVGDEKDPDEADTVGASTLRPEHVCFNGDGTVTLDFLGKDSVRNVITTQLPDQVIRNLKDFSVDAESSLFEGVDSSRVSDFLDEAVGGLSAKVFRTFYASNAVENGLREIKVRHDDPEYVKKHAALLANLRAAEVCNHKRTIPKSWESSLNKKRGSLDTLKLKTRKVEEKLKEKDGVGQVKFMAMLKALEEKQNTQRDKLESLQQQLSEKEGEGTKTEALAKRVKAQRQAVNRLEQRIRDLKSKQSTKSKKLKEQLEKTRRRNREALERLRLQIEAQQATRDYNLGTSLKSYIDPRIYYTWGRRVDFDWKKYYPSTLQKKFSWIESNPAS